ncbi:EAL and HDOD domain-containing protein [Vibrio neonatus]|uniref:EAL and HDOD domain-containing protein n=1 Tax=Vibrio neonatus TaxID=278860 RepID=UPI0021C35EA6|nr:EAL domain-containing protein [Vibrio neonatus]
MYSSYIARQPIFNTSGDPVAYELLYRNSHINTCPEVDGDYATRSILTDLLLDKSQQILDGICGYINFSHQSIIAKLPLCLPKGNFVIEVLEGDKPSLELLDSIKYIAEQGYTLALDDFIPSEDWEPILPFISIIKFDIKLYAIEDAKLFIQQHRDLDIQFVAEKIEHRSQYQQALNAGFNLFQGYYLSKPPILKKEILNDNYPLQFHAIYKNLRHDNVAFINVMDLPNLHAANEMPHLPSHQFISL